MEFHLNVVWDDNLDCQLYDDNFWLEVASDDISSTTVGQVGMSVCVKFGDPMSESWT